MRREPDQLNLFDPPPRDKQAALEKAARLKGISPTELRERVGIVDATTIDPNHQKPRPQRKPRRWGRRDR